MREEMMNRIAEEIKRGFGAECNVRFDEIKKNNMMTRQAVAIIEPGISVFPEIYIDQLLEKIFSGEISIREVAQKIISIYKEWRNKGNFADEISGLTKDKILTGVTYQLINAGKNKERLCNMPHRKFLDLAAIYRVVIEENEFCTTSFVISNGISERYGIKEAELDAAARKHTEEKGFQMLTMASILAEITGAPEENFDSSFPMWVFSNTKKINGATVMLYSEYFEKLAHSVENDLYVLPSSIHEVIVIPANEMDPAMLKELVREVNFWEVSEDEILSENIYLYSLKGSAISIA